MGKPDKYTQECIDIAALDLSEEEEKAIAALNARIKINDDEWGDSLNDEQAVLRVVLAARRTSRALAEEEAALPPAEGKEDWRDLKERFINWLELLEEFAESPDERKREIANVLLQCDRDYVAQLQTQESLAARREYEQQVPEGKALEEWGQLLSFLRPGEKEERSVRTKVDELVGEMLDTLKGRKK